jgi:diadenosine tetraphosphate (Ap4A) HIT family hydrolase
VDETREHKNMECIICERKLEKNILFENDKIIIMLAVEPSVNGHIQIFSKEHYTIMEQVPDDIINLIMSSANKMSMILFESMKVHGTNIIINNGVPAGQKIPHFSVDILPRRTDDNLKLDWTLKQAAPETLDSIHRIIEEGLSKPEETSVSTTFSVDDSDDIPELKEAHIIKEGKRDDRTDKTDEDDNSEEEHKTNYYHQLLERIP